MKTEESRTKCLNCGHTYKGQFCPHCGQKAKTKRLQFVELIKNFIAPFIGGDSKVVNTCRDLFIRPGYMVRDYLLGKRIRYYNPLQMLIFAVTTYAIASYVLGVSSSIFDDLAELDFDWGENTREYVSVGIMAKCAKVLYTNKIYGTFFLSLLAVFPYRMLFRTKILRPDGAMQPLNLTEQFYTQMFFSCLQMMISIILLPVCLINGTEDAVQTIYQVAGLVYVVVIYKQLLGIGWLKSALLNVLAIILAILFVFVLIIFVLVVALVIEHALK